MINKKIFFFTSAARCRLPECGSAEVATRHGPLHRRIDEKMTVEEKIGQLNLPVTGEITTGQTKSSDIAAKIKRAK